MGPQSGHITSISVSHLNNRDNDPHLTGIMLTSPEHGTHPNKPQIKAYASRPLPHLPLKVTELSVCSNWLTAVSSGFLLLGERKGGCVLEQGAEEQKNKDQRPRT